MAEFTLPRNSKITRGRTYKPETGERLNVLRENAQNASVGTIQEVRIFVGQRSALAVW